MPRTVHKKSLAKLTDDLLYEIRRTVETENLDDFVNKVQDVQINYKSINQLKYVLRSLNKKHVNIWAEELFKGNETQIVVAGILFELAKIWERDSDYFKGLVNEISVSDDWRIRDVAIKLLSKAMITDFHQFKPLFELYSNSNNQNQRRVAISAAKKISSLPKKHNDIKLDVLNLVKHFLYEESPYVKSVVNDTFSNGFYKNSTDLTEKWVWEIIPETKEKRAKASIISIFSSNVDPDNMQQVFDVILHYIKEEDRDIKNARTDVLRHLSRLDSKKVSNWLEEKLENNQIVEHWAELETEGLLQ